jgi:acetyl-CoA carboxylase alpha subunit
VTDWRDGLLARLQPLGVDHGDSDALRVGTTTIGDVDTVVAAWDFTVHGGSFGRHDAAAFVAACDHAVSTQRPLVSLLRSGGTRLQEGMAALVGIPRATLALDALARARLPHLAVVDQPTTGGVWVAVGSTADLRVGVRGAVVGFSGPRVVEAMTGTALLPGANTAETAADAGLLDDVVEPTGVVDWLAAALEATRADAPTPVKRAPALALPDRSGWEQVAASRSCDRPSGAELVGRLLPGAVALGGADDSVVARAGRLAGRRVAAVALAASRATRVTPAGFALLARTAALADRLDLALLVLVDSPGADPLPDSERAGVAPAIADAMRAVLSCRAPSLSVVHGEGGSGGALAGAVTDVVGVTVNGWFAALGPEGAAAALRTDPATAADLMGVTPRDLLASGFADALTPAEPEQLAAWAAARLGELRAQPDTERLQRRRARWAAALPGTPPSAAP